MNYYFEHPISFEKLKSYIAADNTKVLDAIIIQAVPVLAYCKPLRRELVLHPVVVRIAINLGHQFADAVFRVPLDLEQALETQDFVQILPPGRIFRSIDGYTDEKNLYFAPAHQRFVTA